MTDYKKEIEKIRDYKNIIDRLFVKECYSAGPTYTGKFNCNFRKIKFIKRYRNFHIKSLKKHRGFHIKKRKPGCATSLEKKNDLR